MHLTHPFTTSHRVGAAALLLSVTVAGCGNDQAAGGAAAAAPPPTAVKVVTLEQKPVEQASEFIATIRSLRSSTVQPEVDGLITRIFVKSGDHVRAGAPLVQINAAKQQATVKSTEANRAGTEADVQYLAAAGQAARVARRRGRHQPAGVRPGPELPAHGRSAARRARSAGQRGPRRAGVLPRRRAAVGSDWRYPRAHRRSGHHVHGDHDHRRERRARGLHSDSPRSLAESAHGPAGAAARRRGQADRLQPHHLRRAARRRRDADGPGEERAPRTCRRRSAFSSSCAPASCGRARPD